MALIENMYCNGLFAGLVAAIVMSVSMILARYLKWVKFSFSKDLGRALFKKYLSEKTYWAIGGLIHLAIGSGWGLVYVLLVDNLKVGMNILSGLIFSLIPWFAMLLVFLPLLGEGMFGKEYNQKLKDHMLLFHLIYGLILGLLISL